MTPDALTAAVSAAVRALAAENGAAAGVPGRVVVERRDARRPEEYGTNAALRLGAALRRPPLEVAAALAERLRAVPGVKAVAVAGPGFLNIVAAPTGPGEIVRSILARRGGGGCPAGPSGGPLDVAAAVRRVRLRRDGEDLPCPDDPGRALAAAAAWTGADAARYALARKPPGAVAVLDVERLVRRGEADPFHRVRYAHARLAAVRRWADGYRLDLRGLDLVGTSDDPRSNGAPDADGFRPRLLTAAPETDLLAVLAESGAALGRGEAAPPTPYRVTRYLERLAWDVHRFLDTCPILPRGDEPFTDTACARAWLAEAARTVLADGLALLGVAAARRL